MKTALVLSSAFLAASAGGIAIAQDQPPPPPPPPPPAYAQPAQPYPNQAYQNPPPAPPPPAAEYPAPISSVNLPPGLDRQQVQTAIFAALHHRGWTVVSTGEHSVVAHLLHHHVDATITLSYNRERVDFYDQSYAVGHHAEDRIMPFTRGDWIRNLEHDISYYVTHGAP